MIIIGEKINGAIPSVARAIEARDADWIRDLARRQSAAGADFIDVCSSVVENDTEVMKWLIDLVQEVCDNKISLDSPNAKSLVETMQYCKKPGLINSVSLEGDKIDLVFPAIKGTDWECVALLCDSSQIPDGIDDRIEIFEKIMKKAKEYEIDPSKLHIDPLVFSVGTKPDAFTNFAAVTRHVREAYPEIHITSGLSNISFGIPSRKTMNQTFLSLAIQAGMDSAIMDPTSRDMIGTMYAAEALMEIDEFCIEYCEAYSDDKFGVQKKS